MKCPNQPGSKCATAGENSNQGFGANAFTRSPACGSCLANRIETAACITDTHSLTVVVSLFGSAFGCISLGLTGSLLLNHNASAEYLDAHITAVVEIKLDFRIWLQLNRAERSQVNRRADTRGGYNVRTCKQTRAARCTCAIDGNRLITRGSQAGNELLRHNRRCRSRGCKTQLDTYLDKGKSKEHSRCSGAYATLIGHNLMSLQKLTRRNLRFGARSGPQFTLLLYVGQWLFRESRRFLQEIPVN